MKASRFALVLVASCMVLANSVVQPQNTPASEALVSSAPPQSFAQVVNQYFKQWDINGDGTLSPKEIDGAVANPNFHDEAAAALAAIWQVVHGGKYALPPITQAYLVSSPLQEPTMSDEQADLKDNPAQPGKFDHPPAFQPRYRLALRRLHKTSRDLFPQSLPSLNACHQGPLADCYFVSVVGAMVYRNPSDVKGMFTKNNDGSTTITFGNRRSIQVAPLTDGEIAISSTAGTNGLWLTVLENAFGKIHLEVQNTDQQDEPNTDSIANGGRPGPVINVLDGYETKYFDFVLRGGKRRRPQFATIMRQNLTTALHEHRLIETVTPQAQLPPGITPAHAYAVLGFDSDTGLLHLWNPHGYNFTPKGSDSLQYGYTTKAGQFNIPLSDWLKIYKRVTFETQIPM